MTGSRVRLAAAPLALTAGDLVVHDQRFVENPPGGI